MGTFKPQGQFSFLAYWWGFVTFQLISGFNQSHSSRESRNGTLFMANPTVLGLLYAYNFFLHSETSENWGKFNDPFNFTLKTNADGAKKKINKNTRLSFLCVQMEMCYLENKITFLLICEAWKLNHRSLKHTHMCTCTSCSITLSNVALNETQRTEWG